MNGKAIIFPPIRSSFKIAIKQFEYQKKDRNKKMQINEMKAMNILKKR